jgi:hypothetical protein
VRWGRENATLRGSGMGVPVDAVLAQGSRV